MKYKRAMVEIHYLTGSDAPAYEFLEEFKRTSTLLPVRATIGALRGHGTQTIVADLNFNRQEVSCITDTAAWVLKFEIYPGTIIHQRLAAENKHEYLARQYLNSFMPKTLRIIGHGLHNHPSALTFQQRVTGIPLRSVSWRSIARNPILCNELLRFCDAVLKMADETGQVPDLAGTLPRIDHLSNIFWRSRNILIDTMSLRVWLVDTGWKDGEESLKEGKLRSRARTWFRLFTLRFFRFRLLNWLKHKCID